MTRYCLALDLNDDEQLIAEYEAWHNEKFPAEIGKTITGAGITDMQIYRTGNRLFMIMEVDESFDAEDKARKDEENPTVQDWEKLMWKFQKPLPWAKPGQKWVMMEKIFQL
jgi:L-rhamnose mutarotase